MSFVIRGSPEALHPSGFIRSVTRKRTREALKLVIARGARSAPDPNCLTLNEDDIDPDKWLLKGWTYIFRPTLSAYKAPMPALVDDLRLALQAIKQTGDALEMQWAKSMEYFIPKVTQYLDPGPVV
ncbi:hypothetical protein FRB99_007285 [Tulasnella sp. 403]|nr:hypothetical protein FRB99_007285 [Tulasnella sp. 403]